MQDASQVACAPGAPALSAQRVVAGAQGRRGLASARGALQMIMSDPDARRGACGARPGRGGPAQAAQAAAWQRYLAWERGNAQNLDGPALAARVILAYDQALGPLVHFPEARARAWRVAPRGRAITLQCHALACC